MISLEALCDLYQFNYWARDRQLQSCSLLTPEQFLRPMDSSHSSVRDTLAHMLMVEWIWLERWQGKSPGTQDIEPFSAVKFPTLTSLQDSWTPIEKRLRNYLQACPEERLSEPLTYTNMQGKAWTYPLGSAMLHVVNHQSYHRGQVATLIRQLGGIPLPIDYLVAFDLHAIK